jgi:ABC-2 type transport system ATP-binding protein
MTAMVETTELTKIYDTVTALQRCSLAIAPGQIVGLLGPNGSGKTTLVRLLLGFLKPSLGTARVGPYDCERASVAVRQLTAYLPAETRLSRRLSGREVLQFFAQLRPGTNPARALRIADRLGLDLNRTVSLMSTGMRQKTALAAVLGYDTPLVILDEPTASLDPTARSEVLSLVREARDEGRTVLFSSHVLSEVEEVCDRVAVLRFGELVHEQSLHELRRQHRLRLRLRGPLPTPPAQYELTVSQPEPGVVQLDTPAELAPLLGWLATLPLEDIRIEPLRLQAVYERFHPGMDREQ